MGEDNSNFLKHFSAVKIRITKNFTMSQSPRSNKPQKNMKD